MHYILDKLLLEACNAILAHYRFFKRYALYKSTFYLLTLCTHRSFPDSLTTTFSIPSASSTFRSRNLHSPRPRFLPVEKFLLVATHCDEIFWDTILLRRRSRSTANVLRVTTESRRILTIDLQLATTQTAARCGDNSNWSILSARRSSFNIGPSSVTTGQDTAVLFNRRYSLLGRNSIR